MDRVIRAAWVILAGNCGYSDVAIGIFYIYLYCMFFTDIYIYRYRAAVGYTYNKNNMFDKVS